MRRFVEAGFQLGIPRMWVCASLKPGVLYGARMSIDLATIWQQVRSRGPTPFTIIVF
jgi:hypothetical protein